MKWSKLSKELKRRGVYAVVAAYAVVAWVLLQVAEVTFKYLLVPRWFMTVLIVVAIVGFPVAVILSWLFDFTRMGIKRDVIDTQVAVPDDSRPSIAVLPFADMSADQDQGYFCEGVAEEILNALTRISQLRVGVMTESCVLG